MNRHDRRRAVATKAESAIPPGYYRACSELVDDVVAWMVRTKQVPLFQMPPKDVHVIVPLSKIVDRIALNEHARALVEHVCQKRPFKNEPTLMMMDVAMGVVGVPVERVSLEALGIDIPPQGSA
jgi:hypothetical protein